MLRRGPASISLLMVLTLSAPICVPLYAGAQASSEAVSIYGLEGISLDSWTQALALGSAKGTSMEDLRGDLGKVLDSSTNAKDLFRGLSEVLKMAKVSTSQDYHHLGTMLMEFREAFRQRKEVSQRVRQDALFLLQMMAEESFYVGSQKFADFPKEAVINAELQNTGKSVALRQFSVQTGDVVLSKATGAGSSAFIALSMDHPHIFSHSTPIYISEKSELLSPEADIEDGVKLRSMERDYIGDKKTRMFIYRSSQSTSTSQKKLETAMQSLIAEMYQRTDNDPFNKAAFKYDFSMLPGDALGRGLFCSAVAYEVYTRAGAQGLENPYSKAVWSPVNKGREILLQTLSMSADRVPAPGDVELNRSFQLVGARIDISKLQQDRIEMAIVDSFLTVLETNKQTMLSFSQALGKVGDKALDKNSLKLLAASGVLPKALADKVGMVDKIPDSINGRQMAFFAFLNEYMVPKVRAAMMAQVEGMNQQGQIVGPVALRKMALQQGQAIQAEVAGYIKKISAL